MEASTAVASITFVGSVEERAPNRGRIGVETDRNRAVFGAGVCGMALLQRDLMVSGAGRSGVFGGESRPGDKFDQGAISPRKDDGSESDLGVNFSEETVGVVDVRGVGVPRVVGFVAKYGCLCKR